MHRGRCGPASLDGEIPDRTTQRKERGRRQRVGEDTLQLLAIFASLTNLTLPVKQ